MKRRAFRIPAFVPSVLLALTGASLVAGGCGEDTLTGPGSGDEEEETCEGTACLECGPHEVIGGNTCVCADGYERVGEDCVAECPTETTRNDEGECICADGLELVDGACVPECEPGTERVDGACVPECEPGFVRDEDGVCQPPPGPGTLSGRVCDQSKGIWLGSVIVSIDLADGSNVVTLTDGDGYFTMTVPEGVYYVSFEGPDGYTNVLPAQIIEGQETILGPAECIPPPGHLTGRVCDEVTGTWLSGATVTLNDLDTTTVTTDAMGVYRFYSVPPGDYVITITHPSGYSATKTGTVISGIETELGPAQCQPAPGAIHGQICGTDGYWLANASVYVLVGGDRIETTTDGDGMFVLLGVPPGNHVVHVEKGSFSVDIPVTVSASQPTYLPEPVCIPPTTRIAVVTGIYDDVGEVLNDLGYAVRATYYNSPTPTIQNSGASVDIIDGTGPAGSPLLPPNFGDHQFWLNGFLMDPVWMSDYDIIFFNCGLDDQALINGTSSTTALNNLRNFVNDGGSMYASDWAAEVVKLAFPGRIKFDTDQRGRIGVQNTALTASVIDSGLRSSLGTSTVTVNLNLDAWVMMRPYTQQAPDVRELLRANVQKYTGCGAFGCTGTANVGDVPLTVRFEYGGGRVLYTSVHNESNNTADLERVLNYIVFEL